MTGGLPQLAGGIRVLAVVPGDGQGRSFIFARRQIASLGASGVDVRTFFLASRTAPRPLYKEWQRLRRELRQFRPHLIHAHYGTMTAFLCAAATKIPLVITFRGADLDDDPDVSWLRNRLGHVLSQVCCLKATAIICVSRRLRNLLWWQRKRAVVIPSGIDLQLFRPQSKEEARALLGWEQHGRVVVFNEVGCPRVKGTDFLRLAVRAAEQIVGPIRLVILDGSTPPQMVPCYLNGADCLALASVTEGSPNIVKEALACNLPVVTTDVGDVAERLENVVPSRVAVRDVAAYAKALTELLRENRRSNGREAVSNCSTTCVAEAIRSVYEASLPADALITVRLTRQYLNT